MTPITDEPTPALPYATPAANGGSSVAAGVWTVLAGLVLIFFGGCFAIGILLLTTNALDNGFHSAGTVALTWEQHLLMIALYACGIGCIVVGAWVMSLGIRKLLAVGR